MAGTPEGARKGAETRRRNAAKRAASQPRQRPPAQPKATAPESVHADHYEMANRLAIPGVLPNVLPKLTSQSFNEPLDPQFRHESGPGDAPPIPHVAGFNSIYGQAFSRTYRIADEALKQSTQDAAAMELDLAVWECLEARWRGVSQQPWHLEAENPKDPKQVELVSTLTKLIERTHNFTEFRRSLLEANWRGKHAIQCGFVWRTMMGRKVKVIQPQVDWGHAWYPMRGDKIAFGWDDERRVAVRINPTSQAILENYKDGIKEGDLIYDHSAGYNRKLEIIDGGGYGWFLYPAELERIIIHRHMIEDAAYDDPEQAGKIHGVGIRHRIYWTWFQKQSALQLLFESFERGALGMEIWSFPWGNADGREAMVDAANERVSGRNILFVPKMAGQEELYGVERIETGMQSLDAFDRVIHQFFNWQIKRYILGQVLSSEPEAGGLGSSGITDFQAGSLHSVLSYDADLLSETLTGQFIPMLRRRNRHVLPIGTDDVHIRFVIDMESPKIEETLKAIETAYNMGLPIGQDGLYEIIGQDKPAADDEILPTPTENQQAAAPSPFGGGGFGGPPAPPAAQPAPMAQPAEPQPTPVAEAPPVQ